MTTNAIGADEPTPVLQLWQRPFSPSFVIRWLASAATGRRRNLGRDAEELVSRFRPAPQIIGATHIPATGPFVLVMNHYGGPTLRVWWAALLASSEIWARRRQDPPIHWLIIDAPRRVAVKRLVVPRPFVALLMRLVIRTYDLISVSHDDDPAPRAMALRKARRALTRRDAEARPVGLTPEAGRGGGPELAAAWPGSGRAVAWLSRQEVPILPVAAYDDPSGRMTVRFGEPFVLERPTLHRGDAADEQLLERVMLAIAALLPAEFRGAYSAPAARPRPARWTRVPSALSRLFSAIAPQRSTQKGPTPPELPAPGPPAQARPGSLARRLARPRGIRPRLRPLFPRRASPAGRRNRRRNPFAPEVKADPYAHYERWRAKGPVVWSEELAAWLVTGYQEARYVLQHRELFSSKNSVFGGPQLEHPEFPSIINTDEPRHAQLRGLVTKAFARRSVDELWEPRIRELVDELLDAVLAKGEFDVVRDLAYPLPVRIIAEIIGVEPDDFEYFKQRSDAAVTAIGRFPYPALGSEHEHQHEPRDPGVLPLWEYLRHQIAERREHPRDDLITLLIEADVEGERLSDHEIIAFLTLLLVAGNETTTNLIGQAIRALAEHPGMIDRVRDDPALVDALIEEALRWEPPIQSFYRRATADARLGGTEIKMGDAVLVMFGAANRDPTKYSCPGEFEIGRGTRDHLAFGAGIHYCLGANLARLEARIAIEVIVARFHMLEVAPGFKPTWRDTPFFRGPAEFRLRFEPRPGAQTAV